MSDVKDTDKAPARVDQEPKNVVDAAPIQKEAPPESPESIQRRRNVVLSFWFVVVFLGLPIWWITTTVYRANLPLEQMSNWAEGKICSPIYPLRVAIEAPSLQRTEAQHLLRSTQHTLDDLNHFPIHHLRLSLPRGIAEPEDYSKEDGGRRSNNSTGLNIPAALTIKLQLEKGTSSPRATLRPHSSTLDVTYSSGMIPNSASSPSVLSTFLANQLSQLFVEEHALLAALSGPSSPDMPDALAAHLSTELTTSIFKRTIRSVKYAPTYHLTFSLFTSTGTPSGWDIERGLAETFAPLLRALSPISNFTVDTQVQPYSSLPPSVRPTFDDVRKVWQLSEEDLGGFVNAAEWPLSPSIGAAPTINFLIYAAPPNTSPLVIEHSTSASWLVPQWGGVAILNSHGASNGEHGQYLSVEDVRPALFTFSSQLMSLLGVPSTPAQSLPMRLSTLTRVRAASLFYSASSTLGSLARLVSALPSISIPDSVTHNVAATIRHLELACSDFRAGDFGAALQNGKTAEGHAEKAFFEKSMVGQVYFPDEHKVAVYLPLLGPVAVPLVVAAMRELKAYLQSRRAAPTKP